MKKHYIFGARTDFSLGESTLQVKRLVKVAKELGADSVALTDTMNVSGLVEFCNEATNAGIKPLLGCTLRVYQDPTYRKPKKGSGEVERPNPTFQMKVFVRNDEGLRWLLALLSKANSADYFYYHSRTGVEDLETAPAGSVIFTTGDLFNMFHMGKEKAREIITRLSSNNKVFVELVPINTPLFDRLNSDAFALAVSADLPMIVSRPAYYEKPEHADSLDVLRAICTQNQIGSRTLPIPYTRDLSLCSHEQFLAEVDTMLTRIGVRDKAATLEKLLSGNEAFATAQDYEFKKLAPSLPKMAENEFAELVKRCKEGWARRFSAPVMGHQPTPADLPVYRERLAYELGVLQKLGFSGYFLLTQEIVRWSKSNEILVGPGRGSCFLAGQKVILDGESGLARAIEDIVVGDMVIAHDGSRRKVLETLEFDRNEEIIELEFDNGVRIECTKDHKFFTRNRGWVRADEIAENDEFDDVRELAKKAKSKT